MADALSTTRAIGSSTSASGPTRNPNHLRVIEGAKSPLHLGIKIKRISQQVVTNHSRGTLGGFLSLHDLDGADGDGVSPDKGKQKEKECCLTTLTKKMGLGIYVQARSLASSPKIQEVDESLGPYGDERETWYMLSPPPPPSPSLALEPTEWASISSLESNSNVNYQAEDERDYQSCHSGSSGSNLYASSQIDSDHEAAPKAITDEQNVKVRSPIPSAEQLAEQYRDLIVLRCPTPVPSLRYPPLDYQPGMISSFQSLEPIIRPAPRTIRKVKAQDSLRGLLNATGRSDPPISLSTTQSAFSITPTTPTTLPRRSSIRLVTEPNQPKAKSSPKSRAKLGQPPSPPPRESSLRQTAKAATRQTNPLDGFRFQFVTGGGQEQWPLFTPTEPSAPKRPRPSGTAPLLTAWGEDTPLPRSRLWFPSSMPQERYVGTSFADEAGHYSRSFQHEDGGWF